MCVSLHTIIIIASLENIHNYMCMVKYHTFWVFFGTYMLSYSIFFIRDVEFESIDALPQKYHDTMIYCDI